jgi:hypothetical protein
MEIAEIDKEKLIQICRRNDVSFLGAFGSFARGEARPFSDLDLLVRFSKRKSLLALVRIERELSETLGRKVDLLTEASISPYLRDRIKAETMVIYNEQT